MLEYGKVVYEGNIDGGIAYYLQSGNDNFDDQAINKFVKNQNDDTFILNNFYVFQDNSIEHNFFANKKLDICIGYEVIKKVFGLRIGFDLIDLNNDTVVFRSFADDKIKEIEKTDVGNYILKTSIPSNFLKEGLFGLKLTVGIHNSRWIVFDDSIMIKFSIINVGGLNSAYNDIRPGIIMPQLEWNVAKVNS